MVRLATRTVSGSGSSSGKVCPRSASDEDGSSVSAVSAEATRAPQVLSTSGPRSAGLSDEIPKEGRVGRGMARQSDRCASAKERRTAVSPFRSLPELHPHEVELRVSVKDLSRDVAPEKFRSKAKSVGGFVFGLLVFPQGTKSAPEHARKNRPGKGKEEDDTDKAKARRRDTQKTEKEKLKAALLKEVPKEKERDKENEKDGNKDGDGKEDKKDTRWISAFVEARPSEDYPPHWYFEDVQFLVSLINFQDLKKSIVKHDKHTFSPVESSDGKAIDRGWHDFVHCDEATLRNSGFVDKDDTVCFRASVYLAGGAMKVNSKSKSRYMSLSKIDQTGSYERAPQFLNSLVQIWYHLGYFRSAIYSASNPCQLSGAKKSRVLPALREIFVRLQHRTLPASCSVLCAAFGRKGWQKICKADPDVFCSEVFQCLESELMPSQEMLKAEEAAVKAAAKAKGKKEPKPEKEKEPQTSKASAGGSSNVQANAASTNGGHRVPVEVPAENRTLWQCIQDMFTFEVEWAASAVEGDFSDSCLHTGPCFTLVVRGFANLEETLDQYFSPKVVEDGSGLRVRTTRKFKRMPSVLQWYLKRGDYDCCTGLSGLTETFLRFPRQIDMGKYAEGGAVYHLYAIMVECDDHYLSYIRPEMEGDRGQWYRFDDREAGSAVCGVSNATAVDASFGGEEWLCVNYLYGPSAVLKRPRESRASMLLYLKDSELQQLLREPKLPKLCPELQMPLQRGEHLQAGSVELEAAAAAEAELLNDLHVEQLKEVKKKKAKQKKKQKEKERKHQVRPGEDSGSFEPVRDTDEREEDSEDDEEAPSEPPMEAVEKEVDSDEEGFEEVLRVARGKKRGSKSQSNSGNTLFAGQGEASGSRASSAGRAPPSQEEKNEEELLAPQPGPGQPSPEELPAEAEPQEPEQARKKKGKQKKRKERERERRPQVEERSERRDADSEEEPVNIAVAVPSKAPEVSKAKTLPEAPREVWDSKEEGPPAGLDQSFTSCTRSSARSSSSTRGESVEVNGDVGDGPLSARELGQGRESPPGRAARATPAPPNTAVPSGPEPTNRRPTDSSGSPGGSISTGLFQADRQWEALEGGTLAVQRGTCVWVLQLDPNSDWALGQVFKDWSMQSDAGWVPRCVLTLALFRVYSPYDSSEHAEVQALALKPGDLVTVQSFGNGWSYGNRVGPGGTVEASGWFPQTCIFQPLPLQ